MDVTEKAKTGIRRFVCDQLRDEPDLSTLTLRILKKRYLERAQCDSLSPEVKLFIKRVVEEELIKMQENDENDSELETKKSQNKRKRDAENDEVLSGGEDEDVSKAKKPRRRSSPSSESEVKKDCKTESDDSEEEEKVKSESEDEKKEVKKSQRTTNGKSKPQISSEESSDEEMNESENKGKESSCEDSPKEKAIKKMDATKNGEPGSSDASKGKKTPQSDEEDKPDTESESEESEQRKDKDPSDDSGKEEKVLVEKKNNDSDSSLTSLDEEQNNGKENTTAGKKKKATKKVEKKEKSASGQKMDDTSIVRLKRYITLCGMRLNYKQVLQDCHSVNTQVAVLKKQLKDLGVDGQPSIKKCRKIKRKREETQELADLDVSNIIATEGRPKRRGTSAWKERQDSPSSTYLRTVNSGSDSDEENKPNRGRKRLWANLQGIISDDADSN
ncbi:HIRA-interacting protein 3 [Notothenia coriiceps]|uniref:HIRA-interacting protein 3 n=1 Tax=Notothenia coriiceps TaxID=8208 RepID=A0A6I9MSU3_9TELE|nr:PREDICTED: HIRA-interacting protein 3 [Notothenia coriiceps]